MRALILAACLDTPPLPVVADKLAGTGRCDNFRCDNLAGPGGRDNFQPGVLPYTCATSWRVHGGATTLGATSWSVQPGAPTCHPWQLPGGGCIQKAYN